MNFTPKRASEIEIFTVDFAPLLAPGETISDPAWTSTPLDGVDAAAGAMIIGSASIDGTSSSQKIGAGVPGLRYAPTCSVLTSLGQVLTLPEVGQGELYISQ